ncbi:hypothetical protein PTSG_11072 [Salpingoeca rosetta]|uniref:Uncharacterized protein n=1 Tax=Salpingoeca rosetta (strain ATCC 50818 / BSB-021) TaxID=946362 RepID=F2US22_SALR5|nr:uncharacterized protein PTSG_11072 [Salpingoeca rosetta]EGD80427.1 hypothetical protein PTSG_11072 [Salpingoeca rosetta]|eukprot:XP_004987991.1 hypothetical protein PTSG_11072 [Salpingoeca rosetta]
MWCEDDEEHNTARLAMRTMSLPPDTSSDIKLGDTLVFVTHIPRTHAVMFVAATTEVYIQIRSEHTRVTGSTWLLAWSLPRRRLLLWICNIGSQPVQARTGLLAERQDVVPCYDYAAVRHAIMLAAASSPHRPQAFRALALSPVAQQVHVLTCDNTLLSLQCTASPDHPPHVIATHVQALHFPSSAAVTLNGDGGVTHVAASHHAETSNGHGGAGDDDDADADGWEGRATLLFWKELFGVLVGRRLAIFTASGEHVQTLTAQAEPTVFSVLGTHAHRPGWGVRGAGVVVLHPLNAHHQVSHIQEQVGALAASRHGVRVGRDILAAQLAFSALIAEHIHADTALTRQQKQELLAVLGQQLQTPAFLIAAVGDNPEFFAPMMESVTSCVRDLDRSGEDTTSVSDAVKALAAMSTFTQESLDLLREYARDVDAYLTALSPQPNSSSSRCDRATRTTDGTTTSSSDDGGGDGSRMASDDGIKGGDDAWRERLTLPVGDLIMKTITDSESMPRMAVTQALVLDVQRRPSTYKSDFARLYIRALSVLPPVPEMQSPPPARVCAAVRARVDMLLLQHSSLHQVGQDTPR